VTDSADGHVSSIPYPSLEGIKLLRASALYAEMPFWHPVGNIPRRHMREISIQSLTLRAEDTGRAVGLSTCL